MRFGCPYPRLTTLDRERDIYWEITGDPDWLFASHEMVCAALEDARRGGHIEYADDLLPSSWTEVFWLSETEDHRKEVGPFLHIGDEHYWDMLARNLPTRGKDSGGSRRLRIDGHWRRLCACGKLLTCAARAPRANRGFVIRKDHDLCQRCWRLAGANIVGVGATWSDPWRG